MKGSCIVFGVIFVVFIVVVFVYFGMISNFNCVVQL